MSDSSYAVEIKLASKNGYFTPDESRAYYGRYARTGYCVHWWGGGEPASAHDSIVNYMLSQTAAGNKSVNYVLSDNKITLEVGPDYVAWCQESGNATEVSVETQPTLTAEGYKKHGWLKNQLDQRYGRILTVHGHNFWFSTACPGSISLDRIVQETDKWARGVYDAPPVPAPIPAPTPTPLPPTADVVVSTLPSPVKKYTLANAKLVDIKTLKVINTYPLDTPIDIGGSSNYNGKDFLLSIYATQHGTKQGFLVGDLKDQPTPVPAPDPPPRPDYVTNLMNIDDTEYWLTEDTYLVDITTGKDTSTLLKKDSSFVGSALTKAGNTEYRITEYSYAKKIYNGVPLSKLTLTKPGVPDIPPVPHVQTIEERLSWLEKAVNAILEFLHIKV